jgi:hypothetical protein
MEKGIICPPSARRGVALQRLYGRDVDTTGAGVQTAKIITQRSPLIFLITYEQNKKGGTCASGVPHLPKYPPPTPKPPLSEVKPAVAEVGTPSSKV